MTTPFKVGCHCGFATEDPKDLIDHCLTTGHVFAGIDLAETGAVAELTEIITAIQRAAAAEAAGEPPVALPYGGEITPLSAQDILDDDTLTDEQKEQILTRWDELKQRLGEDD